VELPGATLPSVALPTNGVHLTAGVFSNLDGCTKTITLTRPTVVFARYHMASDFGGSSSFVVSRLLGETDVGKRNALPCALHFTVRQ